jgi:hypothetical protein
MKLARFDYVVQHTLNKALQPTAYRYAIRRG